MNKTIEAIENATGTAWHALVTHQVLIGLGSLALGLILIGGLYFALKYYSINLKRNVNTLIVFSLVGLFSVAVMAYGLAHIFNPGYFALQDGMSMIKQEMFNDSKLTKLILALLRTKFDFYVEYDKLNYIDNAGVRLTQF